MPARRAFPFTYYRLMSSLTEDGKMRVNALLGDPTAIAAQSESELSVLDDMDVEVG